MEVRLPTEVATPAEQAAIDAVTGIRTGSDRAMRDGYHAANERRHLLLPALHAVQDVTGWIGPGAVGSIAAGLGVPPAEIYGVATFYDLLSIEESPGTTARVCDDIVCASRGAASLLGAAGAPDGTAIEPSPCLGRCEAAPAVLVRSPGAARASRGAVELPDLLAALAGGTLPGAGAPATAAIGERRLLARVGVVDPGDLAAYRAHGGYEALMTAVRLGPAGVLDEVETSGLRGRGGAAFPVGAKWRAVAGAADTMRFVVANADESEPGTFKDRVLMEHDPFALVEAMTIAGFATGAERGFVYVRGEYPEAEERVRAAVRAARAAGLLGNDVVGAGFAFDIEIRRGGGAYICGEETALFASIEGFRGEPRQKPPYPTEAGLFGRPTAVNNVETLAAVLDVLRTGGAGYAAIGTGASTGTKLFCLSGAVERPGVYEVPFGTTLGDLLDRAGARTPGAVLLGGAAGSFVPPASLEVPLTFEGTAAAGLSLGSGAVVVFARGEDLSPVIRKIAAFFRHESCGQCVPCRVGTIRQEESLIRLGTGADAAAESALLGDIEQAMRDASICGLGQLAGTAVASALRLGLIGGDR